MIINVWFVQMVFILLKQTQKVVMNALVMLYAKKVSKYYHLQVTGEKMSTQLVSLNAKMRMLVFQLMKLYVHQGMVEIYANLVLNMITITIQELIPTFAVNALICKQTR